MSVLQISRTIPCNARKAVAEVRKIQAGKEVTKREDMEKAFPPVFSNLNLVVVAGNGPVEKCRAGGQQAAASGAFSWVVFYAFRSVFWRGLDNLSRLPADHAGKALLW